MRPHIGKEVRRLREAKGWSLDDAQREIGVSRDTLSRIELGKRNPHPSTVRAIARGLRLRREDVTDPRLAEAIREENKQKGESSGERPEDRLAQLMSYVASLEGKARADFINAAIAVLTLAGQSGAASDSDAASKHGR